MDALFLAGYVSVAASASMSSMRALGEAVPERDLSTATGRRLVALTAGLMLPGVATLIDGLNGGDTAWAVVGASVVVMSLLVVLRMSGLLEVVQVQAIQLAALARSDSLTGAPNRRTWDHELSRACRESRDTDVPVAVAILDLDHFKQFNDRHGHPAGDLVLRESVAAWTTALDGRGMLARYGGEEFTVLLPGHTLEQALSVIESLRVVTPSGQTFSAGIAGWDPAIEPGSAVARADEAMYVAKRNGRDRVVVHPGGGADPVDQTDLPAFTVLLQPLVDVAGGRVVGHEALCRFVKAGVDPVSAFRVAHERGWGDLLEAAAIRTAMELPGTAAGHRAVRQRLGHRTRLRAVLGAAARGPARHRRGAERGGGAARRARAHQRRRPGARPWRTHRARRPRGRPLGPDPAGQARAERHQDRPWPGARLCGRSGTAGRDQRPGRLCRDPRRPGVRRGRRAGRRPRLRA